MGGDNITLAVILQESKSQNALQRKDTAVLSYSLSSVWAMRSTMMSMKVKAVEDDASEQREQMRWTD